MTITVQGHVTVTCGDIGHGLGARLGVTRQNPVSDVTVELCETFVYGILTPALPINRFIYSFIDCYL